MASQPFPRDLTPSLIIPRLLFPFPLPVQSYPSPLHFISLTSSVSFLYLHLRSHLFSLSIPFYDHLLTLYHPRVERGKLTTGGFILVLALVAESADCAMWPCLGAKSNDDDLHCVLRQPLSCTDHLQVRFTLLFHLICTRFS